MKTFYLKSFLNFAFFTFCTFFLQSCNKIGTATFSGAAIQGNSPGHGPTLSFGTWITPATNSGNVSVISFTVLDAQNGETVSVYMDSGCNTSAVGSALATGSPVTATIVTGPLKIGTTQTFNLFAKGTSTTSCSSLGQTYSFSCPTGYIPVPGNSAVDAPEDFCVMKWEAKCATDATGSSGCTATTVSPTGAPDASKVAVSTSAGLPWRSITQVQAATACNDLNTANGVLSRYDLISNPEWMAIARNIENKTNNWSGGSVGSGYLGVGHANSTNGFHACDGARDSLNADDCLTQGSDNQYKRTHILSNGQLVWDISGNMWEWVDWAIASGLDSPPTSCNNGWRDIMQVSGVCPAFADKTFAPLGTSYTIPSTSYGFGRFDIGNQGAAIRGGEWYDETLYAGIYAMMTSHNSATSMPEIGFRCVYRPNN